MRLFSKRANPQKTRNERVTPKYVGVLLVVFMAAFLCSELWYQLALIQGNSMYPSLHNMQFVLVDKYHRQYSPGDIIVFRKAGIKGVLIKRIIAAPGDRVEITKNRLYVNDAPVSGTFSQIDSSPRTEAEIILRKDSFFVLGDNVNQSIDSRSAAVGDVLAEEIIGKVIWPSDHC